MIVVGWTENIECVFQTVDPRERGGFFSPLFPFSHSRYLSLLHFFSPFSPGARGHAVLTCRPCPAAAERLSGLLVVPSFRQLCKEELGLCGYRSHVGAREYRFYPFPPPTAFLLPRLPSIPLPPPVLAIITAIHIERLHSVEVIRPRRLMAGCKQS